MSVGVDAAMVVAALGSLASLGSAIVSWLRAKAKTGKATSVKIQVGNTVIELHSSKKEELTEALRQLEPRLKEAGLQTSEAAQPSAEADG